MHDPNVLSISTSLPVSVTPSSTAIVFCPETNSYSLSLGVTVQLPIPDLVEVLLKFNAEHVVPQSSAESSNSHSLLASLPEASPYSLPDSSVYTPKAHASAGPPRDVSPASTGYPEDDFMRIPIALTRQDPLILEYRERAKWTRESGRFFVDNSQAKQEARSERLNRAIACFEDMMFANESESFTANGSKKLSADAPEFTPGSAFASTYVSDASDSVRMRAFSENAEPRRERSMSALSFLPPSAMIPEEAPEVAVQAVSPSKQISSFWARVTSQAGLVAPPENELQRQESRPAECKQM